MPFWQKQRKAYISVQAIGSEKKLQTEFVLFAGLYFLVPLPLIITTSTMTSYFSKEYCIFRISLQAEEFRFERSNEGLSVPFFSVSSSRHQTTNRTQI
jgi:hypothetical protein